MPRETQTGFGVELRPMRNQADALELLVYDFVDEFGVRAIDVVKELSDNKTVTLVNVRINSAGGNVFDGIAIYNALGKHPARIEVDIEGAALSIASLIAMAGDEIRMAENAMLMIHDPSGFAFGGSDDMEKMAEVLDQTKTTLIATYAARTGQDAKQIADWMTDETWFTAQEAVDAGFADTITESKRIAARCDVSQFANVPPDLEAAMLTDKRSTPTPATGKDKTVMATEPTPAPPAPTPAPAAAPAPATLAELKAELPDADSDFLLDVLGKNLTMPAAQKLWMDQLRAQNEARDAELTKLKAEAAKVKPSGSPPISEPALTAPAAGQPRDADAGGDPIEEWEAHVAAQRQQGRSNAAVIRMARRKNPDLYAAYMTAYNEKHGRTFAA